MTSATALMHRRLPGAFRTSLLAAAVSGAALVPPAVAHAAPTTLASERAPTRVAAWESTVMWSTLDPGTGRYQLMKSVDGAAAVPVGVRQRANRPFDIDLGTSRSGSTVAVYTRGGDIYRLDVASDSEAKVKRLSSPKHVERSPTIQRGRITFIRRSGRVDELRIGSATQASRVIVRNSSILHAELGDRHVAYVTSGATPSGGEMQMHVRNLATNADKAVYRARSGGSGFSSITRASYIAGPEGFMWARTSLGTQSGNRLVRYTLGDSKLAYDQGSPHHISTAWAGTALGAVTTSVEGGSESAASTSPAACDNDGVRYCDVVLTGPLSFGLKP